MAVVTRWFSTASAGAGDGTSWANRAQLLPSGNWSSIITGFAFNGSDALECRIGPGTHTLTQTLASGLFTNQPTVANTLFLHGCDSSGNLLTPPDSDWVSSQAPFDASSFPVIATTTNVQSTNFGNYFARCLSFTATARTSYVCANGGNYDWCNFVCGGGFTGTAGLMPNQIRNSVITMTGNAFDQVLHTALATVISNVRVDGSSGTGSGNRYGVFTNSAVPGALEKLTVIGCAGGGVYAAQGSVARATSLSKSLIINCGVYGFRGNPIASQTNRHQVIDSLIINSGIGIDGQSTAYIFVSNVRMRDNATANFSGMGNYPIDYGVDLSAGTNTDEFVDAAGGDYRIKKTSLLWGKGLGPGDEPSSGSLILPSNFAWVA